MICSSCGTENKAGRKFCSRCAAALAVVCASCGAANEPGDLFCGECAQPLGATTEAPAGVAPIAGPLAAPRAGSTAGSAAVAERRLVSILFADLVGFTTLAEGRDAEDTRDLLTRYFDLAGDVIARYGGTVEKFIGDAVMAVWGAPVAREDDAERAVRAGLDLVDAVMVLGPGIQARAGVLTGEAAVTIGATNQGMVAGDLVNTASRLQSVAVPGTVLVGEATHRAASMAIAFEDAGDQVLKGKASPVPAWRALRVVSERGGRNRSETLEAPFVGRDDELRQLKDQFHATSRDGRARLVSVIGAAGIGKTRLAWEFLKYLDGLVETTWYHAGRSPAYGEGISFWALGEMVRERCRLLETDDQQTTRAKISETLALHVPDDSERRWIEPALLALLGVEASPGGSEQLFGAWRTFFERLAASAPVVLVFEDHHYADSGLLDFVDHVLEWSRNVPIYVVTLARPELLEKRPDWGARKRNFTSLYLEPLSEPAMRELLAGLVPGLPAAAIQTIIARADGMPLYAVETIRMLVAEGRLEIDNGVYRPVGDLVNLAVPETLTALIASRLDGLSAADRALVSDAAVLGQSFTTAGLSAVSGIGEDEIEPRLRALVQRELLTLEADPRSPERGQYAFVQALIREVAYNTLAKRDRFFESLGTDEIAGGLAGHYLAAHANAADGPEADALAAQARISLRAAAERAIALGSQDQAIVLLRQALSVTVDADDEAELLERAGEIASSAGRHDDAEAFLLRSIEFDRKRGDRIATARATAALGAALLTARRTAEGAALLEPAVAEFADLGPDPALVALHSQLARALMFTAENRRSVEMADRALEVAEHAGLTALLADTLVTKGTALGELGRLQEGIGTIETGERLARSAGLVSTLLRGLNNRSITQGEIDPRATLAAQHEALALARRMGLRFWTFGFMNGVGFSSYHVGEWDRAVEILGEGLADDPEPEDRVSLLNNATLIPALRGEDVGAMLAELDRIVGDSTDLSFVVSRSEAHAVEAMAAGRLEEALAWFRATASSGSGVQTTDSRCSAAHVAFWLGDHQGAADELAEIEAAGFRAPAVDARRTTIQAGLAAVDGRRGEALGLYREALRRWRDLGLVLDEALCGIDMATLLDPGEPEIAAAVDSTREILTRLRANALLDRLDASLASSGPGRAVEFAGPPVSARPRDPSSV